MLPKTVIPVRRKMPGEKPGIAKLESSERSCVTYAGTVSGNTASILVFSVAALNGLTM